MSAPAVRRALRDPGSGAETDARMRALLTSPDPGPVGERLALLCFTGRRSGREFAVPVGIHETDHGPVVATGSGWRRNFAGGRDAEVVWRGRRRAARLCLVDDVDVAAPVYAELIERYGPELAQRRLGLELPADRAPSSEEVRDAVVREPLTLVTVDLDGETTERNGGVQR